MKIIIISGLKRSASTMCFNFARLILKANRDDFGQDFCKDVQEFQEAINLNNSAEIFLCKTHDFRVVEFAKSKFDNVVNITTYRNLNEIAASGIAKFNWSNEIAKDCINNIVDEWNYALNNNLLGRTISYQAIIKDKKNIVSEISTYIMVKLEDEKISEIVKSIEDESKDIRNPTFITAFKRKFMQILDRAGHKFPILKSTIHTNTKKRIKNFLISQNKKNLMHPGHITGSNVDQIDPTLRKYIMDNFSDWQRKHFK